MRPDPVCLVQKKEKGRYEPMRQKDQESTMKEMMRAVEAGEYSIQAMHMMDESKWIIDILIESYPDMLSEEDVQNLKEIQTVLKKAIHAVNVASNNIFIGIDDAISKSLKKTSYETLLMPREIVQFENTDKILITFPRGCQFQGYSTWLSKKFVHESPDSENYQINYYPGWKFSVYKYEKSSGGRMVPTQKQEIDTEAFQKDIKTAYRMYQAQDLSYMELA